MKKSLGLNSKFFFNSTTQSPLILEYDLSLGDPGNNITLYLSGISSPVTVDWGDGQTETFASAGEPTHTYTTTGVYQVKISGGLTFLGSGNDSYGYIPNLQKKLTKCISFGSVPLTSLTRAFINSSITQVPSNLPTTITDLSRSFWGASSFNDSNITLWDTKNVTSMHYMFHTASAFNQPIGNWDVSKVTEMGSMFQGTAFNQPIGSWDVSSVTKMFSMFLSCPFNQNISAWNTSSVTNMDSMFLNNTAFNQPIGNWNTVNVTSMSKMFKGAASFNQNLGSWALKTSDTLTNMTNMLDNCGMSTENYSRTLIGWANYVAANGAPFTRSLGATRRKFNSTNYGGTTFTDAVSARAFLTDSPQGWTISGDALETTPLILEYDTTLGTAGSNTISAYLLSILSDVTIDWGDNQIETFSTAGAKSHTYATAGTYQVKIYGALTGLGSATAITDQRKLKRCLSFGTAPLTSLQRAFQYSSITEVPNILPSSVTSLSRLFFGITTFNNSAITTWDTSNVTDMFATFYGATTFNQDISAWNTSNVTNMSYMFYQATSFNQNIGFWDTSKVTDMSYMFRTASAFNQPIGNWNTSNVTTLLGMFYGASAFNQDIGAWNISNVTTMTDVFVNATSFNKPIGNWDTSKVTNMTSVFNGASAFNQPIGNWNTNSVTQMSFMFNGATQFNQDLSSWNTQNVLNMSAMFQNAKAFNGSIGTWNTSKVTNMSYMFSGASAFNQPITNWDTSSATTMVAMFANASLFNQNLGSWTLKTSGTLTNMTSMLNLCGMSTENYSRTLIGWANYVAANGAPYTRSLGATGRKYNTTNYGGIPYTDAASARAFLRGSPRSWTISGDALE